MHVLAVSALLASFLAAPAGPASEVLRREYEQAVRQYREGDDGSVARIAAWPREDLKETVAAFRRRAEGAAASGDVAAVRGAALLHTQAAFALGSRKPGDAEFQLALGQSLLEDARSRVSKEETPPSFDCSWWLALVYHQGGASEILKEAEALAQADRACGELPELWLAHGALAEFIFTFGPSDGSHLGPRNLGRDLGRATDNVLARKFLEPGTTEQGALAAGYYRKLLRAEPQHAEAHLRLARVLRLTGREQEAEGHLRSVLDVSQDPNRRYLARLFLGDVLEARGQHEAALVNLRAAAKMGASTSAASLALAHSLFTAGEPAAARAALLPYLARDPAADVTDPWLVYNVGVPVDGFEKAFERLRAAVAVKP